MPSESSNSDESTNPRTDNPATERGFLLAEETTLYLRDISTLDAD